METSTLSTSTTPRTPDVARLKFSAHGTLVTLRWDEDAEHWTHNRVDDEVFSVVTDGKLMQKTVDRGNSMVHLLNAGFIEPDQEVIKSANRFFSDIEQRRHPAVSDPWTFAGMLDLMIRDQRPLVPKGAAPEGTFRCGFNCWSAVKQVALDKEYMRLDDQNKQFARYLRLFARWVEYLSTSPRVPDNAKYITRYLLEMLCNAIPETGLKAEWEEELKRLLWTPINKNWGSEEDDINFIVWTAHTEVALIGDGMVIRHFSENFETLEQVVESVGEENETLVYQELLDYLTPVLVDNVGRSLGRKVWQKLMSRCHRSQGLRKLLLSLMTQKRYENIRERLDAGVLEGEHLCLSVQELLSDGREEETFDLEHLLGSMWEPTYWNLIFLMDGKQRLCEVPKMAALDDCPSFGQMATAARLWTLQLSQPEVLRGVLPTTYYFGLLEFAAWAESVDWTINGSRVPEQHIAAFRESMLKVPPEMMHLGWGVLRDALYAEQQKAGV